MSRRQDREGVARHELQYRRNLQCDPENHLDPKGWYVPHLAWEGWEELNIADYALHCVLVWRNIKLPKPAPVIRDDGTVDRQELHRSMTDARIKSDMRSFRFHIARSRQCDRPMLPA